MTQMPVEELAHSFLEDAKKVKEQYENMHPIALVEGNEETILCDLNGLFGDSQAERAQHMYQLGCTIGFGVDAQRLLVAIDAWFAQHDKDVDLDSIPRPSEDPNRMECIMVTVQDKTGMLYSITQKYTHGEDGIVWDEPVIADYADKDNADKMEDYTFSQFFHGLAVSEEEVTKLADPIGGPDYVFQDTGLTAMHHLRRAARRAALELFGSEVYDSEAVQAMHKDNDEGVV